MPATPTRASGSTARNGADPVCRAVAASPLAGLPERDRARLLWAGREVTLCAGASLPRGSTDDRHLDLVVSGALMVTVMADDDRAFAVRYRRFGDLVGVASLYGDPPSLPVDTRALLPTLLLRLHSSTVLAAASRSGRVATLLLAEQAAYARAVVEAVPQAVSASVPQRVARHLLQMAAAAGHPHPVGSPIRIPVTQQALAQAAGTVREVVVRTLRGLRADGVVATDRDGIVVLDADKLAAVGGTQVPDTTRR